MRSERQMEYDEAFIAAADKFAKRVAARESPDTSSDGADNTAWLSLLMAYAVGAIAGLAVGLRIAGEWQ